MFSDTFNPKIDPGRLGPTRGLTSLICVFLILAAFSAPPANADSIVGDGTAASCTKGAFIDAVLGGGTVTFNCGPDPRTITLISVIVISRDTTIKGGGRILLKASNTNHFKVPTERALELEGIQLIDGKATKGGAIENLGTVRLSGVTLANNTASEKGGAILNNGTLIIRDSTFRENTAGKDGGAIGGDFLSSSILTISNSTFIDNSAGEHGGAVANFGPTTVVLSTFSGNESLGAGGAIFSNHQLSVDRSTLIGNQAVGNISGLGGGGGIFQNSAATLTVTASTLSGNRAAEGGAIYARTDATYTNSTLSGNVTTGHGGGLYHQSGTSLMLFTTVANNSSGARSSSGLLVEGGLLSLQNSLLSNSSGESSMNCSGETHKIRSLGSNLLTDASCRESFAGPGDKLNVDAKLGFLANNGGPTRTHLPQANSPAINKAVMVNGITTDQRGLTRPRPRGGQPDIGSVEVE